jgi:hypothetical protein
LVYFTHDAAQLLTQLACSVDSETEGRRETNTEPGAIATGVKFGMRNCDDQKVLDLLDEQFV